MSKSEIITSEIVRKLKLPSKGSRKGDNGRLFVIAGSEQYHGSLLFAVKTASKVVDLIYVLTTRENRGLVRKLKEKTTEFITVNDLSLNPSPRQGRDGNIYDCVLIGPGMGRSSRTRKLVEKVLKSGVRAVLDADALNVLDKSLLKLLGPQHILTPHQGEFKRLLRRGSTSPLIPPPSKGRARHAWGGLGRGRNAARFVKKYGCTVVLKGKVDLVAGPTGELKLNYTGNEGMTKGGTGDVLAGLIAAFYCLPTADHPNGDKNSAFVAAAAGVYINGKAGDELYKRVGPYYDAEDLVEQIPRTMWRLFRK